MIVASRFRPAWWARSAHLQTGWQSLLRPRPRPAVRRERLELDDGDFMDLDWVNPETRGPVTILLHGLEGSVESCYAAGQLQALQARGMRAVLMHFRGCSGEPNRLRRGYHSGVTEDLARVVAALRRREPATPLAAVGYSLGGNVLLKALGEDGAGAPFITAVAVSAPFDLGRCADHIATGSSRLYNDYLMRRMRASYARKFEHRDDAPFPLSELHRLRTFRDFDDVITAPLHDFCNAEDYYQRASSLHALPGIRIPTLILHARDDPFMPDDVVPGEEGLSPAIRLELSEHGGHVGFIGGHWPWRPRWWLEERITAHLADALREPDHPAAPGTAASDAA